MISRRFLETAEILIYDPVAANRNATRASLLSLGYRKVAAAPTLDILSARLRDAPPDLLLAEVSGGDPQICEAIQSVRRGVLGDNPFIVVLATTWRRDASIITQAVNSGADDLMARPVSTGLLGERIRLHVERRKAFVVTSDYIGPDRRRVPRPGDAPGMDVPNLLKLRASDTATDDEIVRRIAQSVAAGKKKLNTEKVRRDAVQLCLQWHMLERRRSDAHDYAEILGRIGQVASEIKNRALLLRQDAVPGWCDSIEDSVRTLLELARAAAPDGDARRKAPLGMLGHTAMSLGRMLAAEEVEPAQLVALDELVTRRSARFAAA